ncbi:hypothetical protein BASA60_000910 [Batrachochytrium salamandrivorans]|nr:hypothetical protein BASA60_000910 [Batrachochytrium salamandrivorans]
MQLQLITCVVFASIVTNAAVMHTPESTLIKRQVLDGSKSNSKGSNSKVKGYSDEIVSDPDMGKKPPIFHQITFEPEFETPSSRQVRRAKMRSAKSSGFSLFSLCRSNEENPDNDEQYSVVEVPYDPSTDHPESESHTSKNQETKKQSGLVSGCIEDVGG